MPKDRIRFRVEALIIGVAVVAVNFAILRSLFEREPPLELFGAVPLIDVVLIGGLGWMMRRLRLGPSASTPRLHASASAFTYLSANLLVLGVLVMLLIPEWLVRYANPHRVPSDALRSVLEFHRSLNFLNRAAFKVMNDLAPYLGLRYAQIAVGLACYFVMVSGPPLIIAGIGCALAKFAAARLPRWRFRAVAWLVTLGFVSTDLAICIAPEPFKGEQSITIDLQVRERVTGGPVPGARVQLIDPFPSKSGPRALSSPRTIYAETVTDILGQTRLRYTFPAMGYRSLFETFCTVSFWGRWLEVSAPGHATSRIPLNEVLGPDTDPGRPIHGTVALIDGESPEDSFLAISGFFEEHHPFGWMLKIEPDGRFAAADIYGTGFEFPNSYDYGYVKQHGDILEFVPVPYSGKAPGHLGKVRWRVLRFDRHVVLCENGEYDLRSLCRHFLFPKREPYPSSALYVRDYDRNHPLSGLPRLPAWIWVNLFMSELDISESRSSLSILLEPLLSLLPD